MTTPVNLLARDLQFQVLDSDLRYPDPLRTPLRCHCAHRRVRRAALLPQLVRAVWRKSDKFAAVAAKLVSSARGKCGRSAAA